MKITEQELRKLLGLAKLYADEAELPVLREELENIVAFAGQIASAETEAPEEETGVPLAALRADEVAPSMDREALLANARQAENGFFVAGGGRR